MAAVLDAIDDLPRARKPQRDLPADLSAELAAWAERVGTADRPPAVLMRGVVFWARLHGLISLEFDRHLVSMELEPELIYRAELAARGRDLT